jgi:hypothetical protein
LRLLEWNGIPKREFLSDFVEFPYRLYADCPYWFPGLKTWDREQFSANPAIAFHDVAFFLVKEKSRILGRIAVFRDRRPEYAETPVRFGWLDFVDDPEVSSMLLCAAESWIARSKSLNIRGPLGFTDFDRTGILMSGFEHPSSFHSSYNFPYYAEHLVRHGYREEAEWHEWLVHSPGIMPEPITHAARIARERYGFDVLKDKSAARIRRIVPDLFDLLNESYSDLYGFTRFEPEQIGYFQRMWLSLFPKDFFSIVLHPDGRIIGFALAFPSLNSACLKSGGNLFPFGFLRFGESLYGERKNVDLLLIAIRNQCRSRGVLSLLVEELLGNFLRLGISNAHAHWQMSDNRRITNIWKRFHTERHKRRACFEKTIFPIS